MVLVKRDFQNKYFASYIGLPWAFIQPAMSMLVIWFAMTYGLKVGKMDSGLPFVPWFICGMIPWLFIAETIISSSGSLIEYSSLIKKTTFKIAVIPFHCCPNVNRINSAGCWHSSPGLCN